MDAQPTNYPITVGSSYSFTLPPLANVQEGSRFDLFLASVTGASVLTLDGDGAETITYYGTAAATHPICAAGALYRLAKLNSVWNLWLVNLGTSQQVLCDTGNGQGSTDTKRRRYTNRTQTGQNAVVSDSAAGGTIFTLAETGRFAIGRFDHLTSASVSMGLSVNVASPVTTGIASIATANRLGVSASPAANQNGCCLWTGLLAAGDVIAAHEGATACDGTAAYVQFFISRVG